MNTNNSRKSRWARTVTGWGRVVLCRIVGALALFAVGTAWAGLDDVRIAYSTPGTDRYGDGTPVADGECYALVYTRAGASFSGFNRDGSLLAPQDSELVLVAPSALDGACRPTLFQVPKAYVDARRDGTWQVCLLDTRGADGLPAGLGADGSLMRVNRYSLPDAALNIGAKAEKAAPAALMAAPGSAPTLAATERAPLPKDMPQPRITGMSVRDGVVTLAVAGTVPYVTYGVDGGAAPTALNEVSELAPQDGQAGRTIEIQASGTPSARFFRIVEAQ